MKQSTITINGNTEAWCGESMTQSTITINGNTGDNCGLWMKQSELTINGNTGNWCGKYAADSIIYTNNKITYDKIKEQLAKGNKVILYNAQGNILERYPCDQQ